jgi:aldehyde dehydrogenase (NAD+)
MVQDTFSSEDFNKMKQYFESGATRSYKFRKEMLVKLKRAIQQYEQQIADALHKDLHKSVEEAFVTEIGFTLAELSHAIRHLPDWMDAQKVSSPLFVFPSQSKIIRDPLGVTLIISPWNYPFQLLLAPLIGSVAGGNCAVLKPSELTPATSAVVKKLIKEHFNDNYIKVVEGDGAKLVPAMMNDNRFDHVFFTGSIPVGKEIAKLAAPKLVSVTLELGGKSPCIVAEDANINVAAKRITWGKFTNAGQTCVAPDYLLVHEKRKNQLVDKIQDNISTFYGGDPQQSQDYGRIINEKRFDTLQGYLRHGNVITGGKAVREDLYISPTVMDNVSMTGQVMHDEIFGPILPVYTYKENNEALEIIRMNPNPLSLYVFSNNKKTERLFVDNIPFGGGCINNTLVHLANAELPFGGVGNSGIGAYHGKFSFDTFTRAKSVLKTGTWLDPTIKYPPYKGKLKLFKMFFR